MSGMLFSQMEPPAGWDEDFHRWYEDEHIPARMAIPGFASAARYRALEGQPRFLAVYQLDEMRALERPDYVRLKTEPSERTERMLSNVSGFTRYICDLQSDTGPSEQAVGALFVVAFSVPDEVREEFDGWYEDEHIPLLMQVPGWLRVRRYTSRSGSAGPPWTHFALHEQRDPSVMDAPEREAARSTPRRAALAQQPWFKSGRWLYEPIFTATAHHHTTTGS